MKVETTSLPGVLLIQTKRFDDERGYFLESWQRDRYATVGISLPFVQYNVSRSKQGVLRGMHFQNPHAQGKLVSVLDGEVFDVVVDIRLNSKTFGKWFGSLLSAENNRQLWVPPGFAHGFLVTSTSAIFSYKCTDFYCPESEASLRWDDPAIGIDWPEGEKLLASKDLEAPFLRDIAQDRLIFEAIV